jgi:hypothetical protein
MSTYNRETSSVRKPHQFACTSSGVHGLVSERCFLSKLIWEGGGRWTSPREPLLLPLPGVSSSVPYPFSWFSVLALVGLVSGVDASACVGAVAGVDGGSEWTRGGSVSRDMRTLAAAGVSLLERSSKARYRLTFP